MNEEEFVKEFNRTIGKLEGLKLTEHKDLPNEADLLKKEVETLQERIEEAHRRSQSRMTKNKKTASVLEFYESQLGSVITALYIMRQEIRELLKTLEEEEGEEASE